MQRPSIEYPIRFVRLVQSAFVQLEHSAAVLCPRFSPTMSVIASEIPPSSRVYRTNPAPSDLLLQFIAQHNELQSYKYVS